ncbi:MAG: helix-turn-helix transcriptional regulator [Pseudomonadota bacterium]
MNALGLRIRAVRRLLNMTQAQLAELLHISRETVVKWEKGERLPQLPQLIYLRSVFGISIDFIADGDLSTLRQDVALELQRLLADEMARESRTRPSSPNGAGESEESDE